MLTYKPSDRITISEIADDEWFQEVSELNTPEEVKEYIQNIEKEKKLARSKAVHRVEDGTRGGTPID